MSENIRYHALGPLLSGEGSRAFLGLATVEKGAADPVVMVWLPPEIAEDPEQLAAVHKDTLRAATLDHPNIIRVHGLAALEEGVARVVEFADGETLRRVLEVCHKLPLSMAALLVAEVATGLHYAHLAGNDDGSPLVHGDVRPETLMVCFSGITKVSGYGALSVAPKEAGGKRVLHRRLYAAPEQIIGGRGASSVQTDVYLLGLMLFETLTGVMPFQGEANFDEAVVSKPLTLTGYEELPPSLIPVIQRATAKRASDRYPSALAFREAIEGALGPLPHHDTFGNFLDLHFPESDPARAARRRILDGGLADYARKVWDPNSAGSGMTPISFPVAPTPPAQAPAKAKLSAPPAAASKAPAVRTTAARPAVRDSGEFKPLPSHRGKLLPITLASLLGAVAVGIYLMPKSSQPGFGQNSAAAPKTEALPTRAPEPPPAVEAKAAPPTPSASPLPSAITAPEPKVQPVAFHPGENARLELSVTPPVDVSVDHKPMGRTPLDIPLPAGKHTLHLHDRLLGINLSRVVQMPSHGKEVTAISVAKGTLSVDIPSGAKIFLDGKGLGSSSLADVAVYEGSHNLVVMLGAAKWQQSFNVRAGEHMTYNVNSEAP